MASGHVNRLPRFNFGLVSQYLAAPGIRILRGVLQFAFMLRPHQADDLAVGLLRERAGK
jgi:hypothetical protein